MVATIRQHRILRDLSQTDMANRLGIARQSYAKYEANPDTLTIKRAKEIAEVLGVGFNDIIFSPDNLTES